MYNQTERISKHKLILHCKKYLPFAFDDRLITLLILPISCIIFLIAYSNHLWTERDSLGQDPSEPQHILSNLLNKYLRIRVVGRWAGGWEDERFGGKMQL